MGSARRWRANWGKLAIGLVLLLAGGWFAWRSAVGPRLSVVTVTRGALVQRVVASGRVQAPARVQVGTMVGGVVAQVLVDKGAVVQAGDALVTLADQELQAALQQASAQVAQARARLAQLAQVGRPTAEQQLRQAELEEKLAAQAAGRVTGLQQQVVSAADVEQAVTSLALARSRQEAAAARARSFAPSGSETSLALATLAAAEAAHAAAVARLAQTRVVAPCAGTVLERRVEPGDVVPSTQPLIVLARQGEVYLTVQPEENALAYLAVGQRGRASADAFPDQSFPVELTEIAPAVDPLRGTVEVRLRTAEPPAYLRPEMTVSVDLEVARRPSTLLLPTSAVRSPDADPWALVVGADLRARRQPLKLGLRGDGMVELLAGVAEGARVVPISAKISAGQRLRPDLAAPGTPR